MGSAAIVGMEELGNTTSTPSTKPNGPGYEDKTESSKDKLSESYFERNSTTTARSSSRETSKDGINSTIQTSATKTGSCDDNSAHDGDSAFRSIEEKTRTGRNRTDESALRSSSSKNGSVLPPEIWHYIFSFCPPKSLGRLLAVNRLFNSYLDPQAPVSGEVLVCSARCIVDSLKPNAIWQASRRLFWPNMPAPLQSKTELEMWRLACSRQCEECGKLDTQDHASPFDLRHPGPGGDGVATIWSFGSRMCASCLLRTSIKEVDLLLSPTIPSSVVPALPFVFLTQELDVLSASMIEQDQLPAGGQVTKRFFSAHVKALEQEFLAVKDMGAGTVAEWLKGLPGRGNDARHDASKWEKWEISGGVAKMRSQLYPGYIKDSPSTGLDQPARNILPPKFMNPMHLMAVNQSDFHLSRHERTIEQVAELKAARKAEIERRALLLNPPLSADILRHMPSFQAAIQIVHPLDDNAWEILEPRLLTQRSDAEERERREKQNAAPLRVEELSQIETTLASTKEARDLIDKDWEEVQAPLRARIAGFADEIIRDGWGKGKKVNKANCAQFAINVLLEVRKRFYADIANARAAGTPIPIDPPEGPFTQKLTLENMKWVFETKIRLITERYRKELFYCNDCEGVYKTFGFEGVIQHFAAKHTTSLSLGNIVVFWRAEWPEHPPFSAEAHPARPQQFYNHVPPPFPANGPLAPQINHTFTSTLLPAQPHAYPPSSGYAYAGPPYYDHYQVPQQPYAPPPLPHLHAPLLDYQSHYDQQQSYTTPPEPYHPYQEVHGSYPVAGVEPNQNYGPPPRGHYDYNSSLYQPIPKGVPSGPAPMVHHDPYKTQLEDVARNSREVWQTLGNIQDFPGSLRVSVTIHHLVKRFRARFLETPSLSLFIDGLSNHKDMRPVRNVNGLVCKACHLRLGNAGSVEQDRKNFSLPQLTNHFQSKHIVPMQNRSAPFSLDWVSDMILLPDLRGLINLESLVNEAQRTLIAEAVPMVFHQQLSSEAGRHHGHHPQQQRQKQRQQQQTESLLSEGASSKVQPPLPASVQDKAVELMTHGKLPEAGHKGRGGPTHSTESVRSDTSRGLKSAPASATPKLISDSIGLGSSDSSKQSSQGARHNRGKDRHQNAKRGQGNNKRKRNQCEESGGRRVGKAFRRDEPGNRPGGRDANYDLLRRQQPERRPASASEEAETGWSVQDRPPTRPSLVKESSAIAKQESSIFSQYRAPSSETYTDNTVSQLSTGPSTQSQGRRAAPELRFRSPETTGRDRSRPSHQLELPYFTQPGPVEEYGDRYASHRALVTSDDTGGRRYEDGYHDKHSRLSVKRGQIMMPVEPGYLWYRDDARARARPPTEAAYEIVHVIEGQREYYIRRPVRCEPEPRYAVEEQIGHREATSHVFGEGYANVPRPNIGQDVVRGSLMPETRAADRRAGPAYLEEYDPHFPSA
ncbi:hypothetical protein QBC35DRAFT_473642 [Podospora australis]|uniref:F-box domain-containing protein n=1 Tax=Podospora australis TaxID=1536484 RepID=A0AAN6WUB6_9PEZI|nr:hypothetical protein QBC35DRAFT_473642 [Podospora australis]